MKPSDFYNSQNWKHPYSNPDYQHDIYLLKVHIRNDVDWHYIDTEKNRRIQLRHYYDVDYDGRRTCTVGAAFFDEKAVMIYRHGGRDGDEYVDEFITNLPLYKKMVEYIRSLVYGNEDEYLAEKVVGEDQEIPALNVFYNQKFVNVKLSGA